MSSVFKCSHVYSLLHETERQHTLFKAAFKCPTLVPSETGSGCTDMLFISATARFNSDHPRLNNMKTLPVLPVHIHLILFYVPA